MNRWIVSIVLASSALVLAGCWDFESTILLGRDLSGAISIVATIHSHEGEETSREEFEAERPGLVAEYRRQAQEQIPEGVRLRTLDLEWLDERRFAARMEIEFDHVRRLQEIKDPKEEESAAGPSLGEFAVEEKADRWAIRMGIARAQEPGSQDLVPASEYDGRTFSFTLRAEGRILSHNGEEAGGDIVWKKKMREIVTAPEDMWAEWEIAK